MSENKVYEAKTKLWLWGSYVGIFLMATYIGCNIQALMNSGAYKGHEWFFICLIIFEFYILFVFFHLYPRKVEILEDESVRITFLLGNSVALKPHRFKIIRLKDHIPFIKGWLGFVFVRGRFSFFSLSTFPELEKYLNIKGDV